MNILIWLNNEGNIAKIKDDSIDVDDISSDVGYYIVVEDDNDDWE